MNRKQFTLLLALVVVIGGLGLALNSRRQQSWQSSAAGGGEKLLGKFQVNDVAQITIKSATAELNLVKQDDTWRVKERQDYPANFSTLSDFIRKAGELKVVQSEKIGASQFERMELVQPGKGAGAGTLVELKDKDGKPLRALLLGKKQMKKAEANSPFGGGDWPVGRWIMNLADTGTAALVSDPFSDAEPKPESWLDKDFFKVEKVRAIAVTHTNATNSWKLTRETDGGEWKLVDAKKDELLDAAKASALGSPLAAPSFNDVVAADAKPADTGLDQPTVLKLETFEGFTYTAKIGKKSGEDAVHFAIAISADLPKSRTPGKDEKTEDKDKLDKEFKERQTKLAEKLTSEKRFEKYAYLVTKWTVDSLLKDRGQLMVEKKDEPKPEAGIPGLKLPGLPEPPGKSDK